MTPTTKHMNERPSAEVRRRKRAASPRRACRATTFRLLGWLLILTRLFGGCWHESEAADGSGGAAILTGLMDATELDVSSKVPARVEQVLAREGDVVSANQLLVTLRSDELQAKQDQVGAAIDAAEAKLRLARKGARKQEKQAARKALDAARHQLEIAEKMYGRVERLQAQGAVPQVKLDEAEFERNVARDQLAMARARYDALVQGARDEEIEALEALVRQARGSLDEVRSYQQETEQRAPIAAEVARVLVQPGELATTGAPIMTLVDVRNAWASFALREDQLQQVEKGDLIEVLVPALGRSLQMKIYHIAVLGDFATWRATSERNSFDLKSFEVRARPLQPVKGLRPGMTVRWMLPQNRGMATSPLPRRMEEG